jgi:hypothetical protein
MSNHHKFEKSTSIQHIDYDDASSTLKIKFHSGAKEHEYKECPKSVYEGLKAAESPGKYFHQAIRGKFAS